jgi:hypothetical protein
VPSSNAGRLTARAPTRPRITRIAGGFRGRTSTSAKRIGRPPDFDDALALALISRFSRRRLSYAMPIEPLRHPGCTDERPCGDRDCPECGWRIRTGPTIEEVFRDYGVHGNLFVL